MLPADPAPVEQSDEIDVSVPAETPADGPGDHVVEPSVEQPSKVDSSARQSRREANKQAKQAARQQRAEARERLAAAKSQARADAAAATAADRVDAQTAEQVSPEVLELEQPADDAATEVVEPDASQPDPAASEKTPDTTTSIVVPQIPTVASEPAPQAAAHDDAIEPTAAKDVARAARQQAKDKLAQDRAAARTAAREAKDKAAREAAEAKAAQAEAKDKAAREAAEAKAAQAEAEPVASAKELAKDKKARQAAQARAATSQAKDKKAHEAAQAKIAARETKAARRADKDDRIVEPPRDAKVSVGQRLRAATVSRRPADVPAPQGPARGDKAQDKAKASSGSTRRIVSTLAGVVGAIGLICSVVLAFGALLVALDADGGTVYDVVSGISDVLVGPLRDVFSFSGANGDMKEALVAWGAGSIIYLVVGILAQSLLRSAVDD